MEPWERKSPSGTHWVGEMQRAPGLWVMQQHPGMEGAVTRWMGDAWCRQPRCQAQPRGSSLPRPCFAPAQPSASVSPSEQGRVQASRGWQGKGEPDDPREDLATDAGSILLALQSGAGCEVHPHVCQGTPGIAASSPALPGRLLRPRRGRWQHPRCPRSAKGSGGTRMAHPPTPTPSTARHPRLPEPFWPRRRSPGHQADPWLWEMRPRYPGWWHEGQRSLQVPQQHPHPRCRHLARRVTEEPSKTPGVTSRHRC